MAAVNVERRIQRREAGGFGLQLRLLGEGLAQLGLGLLHLPLDIFRLRLHSGQTLGHLRQHIVNADEIAQRVPAQLDPVGHLAPQRQDVVPPEVLHRQEHSEAPVAADLLGFGADNALVRLDQRRACLVLLCEGLALHHHPGKAPFHLHGGGLILRDRGIRGGGLFTVSWGQGLRRLGDHGVGVRGQGLHVGLESGDKALVLPDLLREVFQQLVLQPELPVLVIGLQKPEAGHINVQVHLLFYQRIASAQGLDLRIGQGGFIHVLAGAHRGF